jgi:hypothetical protein
MVICALITQYPAWRGLCESRTCSTTYPCCIQSVLSTATALTRVVCGLDRSLKAPFDQLARYAFDVAGDPFSGFSKKRVAQALKISPDTVKSHIKRSFLKLAVSTRIANAPPLLIEEMRVTPRLLARRLAVQVDQAEIACPPKRSTWPPDMGIDIHALPRQI